MDEREYRKSGREYTIETLLICPVCGAPLRRGETAAACPRGHSYDRAKEGYFNLLRTSRPGDRIGDDRESARSRRDFLNRGYFAPLRDALCRRFRDRWGTLVDICCGEGYYTAALGTLECLTVYGFDISREMVRLAAKRGNAVYFVANLANIPLQSESMDYAVHLFAPFQEASFSRVLRPGGRLCTVVPGERHLFGLKELLYDTPYPNDERLPETSTLRLLSREKISARITLETPEDIAAVFRMTPYFFHTRREDRERLEGVARLETEIEFVIGEYEKPEGGIIHGN